jgi:hypothetical protein
MLLELLARCKDLYHMTIVGHSFMTNHTHIPIPELKTSLAKKA